MLKCVVASFVNFPLILIVGCSIFDVLQAKKAFESVLDSSLIESCHFCLENFIELSYINQFNINSIINFQDWLIGKSSSLPCPIAKASNAINRTAIALLCIFAVSFDRPNSNLRTVWNEEFVQIRLDIKQVLFDGSMIIRTLWHLFVTLLSNIPMITFKP